MHHSKKERDSGNLPHNVPQEVVRTACDRHLMSTLWGCRVDCATNGGKMDPTTPNIQLVLLEGSRPMALQNFHNDLGHIRVEWVW